MLSGQEFYRGSDLFVLLASLMPVSLVQVEVSALRRVGSDYILVQGHS